MNHRRSRSFLTILVLPLLLAACKEEPLAPDLGNGTTLRATVDGVVLTFDIEPGLTTYSASTLDGVVRGASNTVPVRSISISFRGVDLDTDKFPRTLIGVEVGIVLISEDAQGDDLKYVTPADIGQNNSTVTISATDGTIVDGTFSGTLVEEDDPSDKVVITNGVFSARMTRD